MVSDITPLIDACRNKLQVTLNYTKKTTGEMVVHTGGIYEIRDDRIWLWDTNENTNIRQFIIGNIDSFQVLNVPFFPPREWPIKINGEIVG